MMHRDVIVIGGGISGLSAAQFCRLAGKSVLVIEKESRVGGCLHTVHHGDCRLELGAHSFFNSYGNTLGLMRRVGALSEIIRRGKLPYRLLKDGRLRGVLSRLNWPQLLLSLPHLFGAKKEGRTVAQYYGRIMGRDNYRNLFRHFLNAVISQNADQFPADVLFKKRPRDKTILRNFTLQEGMDQLITMCAHNLDICTSAGVKAVHAYGNGYRVALQDDRVLTCDYLILAVPAPTAEKLLQSASPKIAQLLQSFRAEIMTTSGVICRAEDLDLKRLAGIVAPDDPFYSVVSMDVILENDQPWRAFSFHFKRPAPGVDGRKAVIRRVLNLKAEPVAEFERETVLPAYKPDHAETVRELDDVLEGKNLFLTGNYLTGLSIEDCVTRSKEVVGRVCNQRAASAFQTDQKIEPAPTIAG
ncbi:MAG: FAD-dependent oxidoreductase [Acidobacteriota bacterium]|nr:FAD-dependent oxidoreductase [Acidobacteriota bacterium]